MITERHCVSHTSQPRQLIATGRGHLPSVAAELRVSAMPPRWSCASEATPTIVRALARQLRQAQRVPIAAFNKRGLSGSCYIDSSSMLLMHCQLLQRRTFPRQSRHTTTGAGPVRSKASQSLLWRGVAFHDVKFRVAGPLPTSQPWIGRRS